MSGVQLCGACGKLALCLRQGGIAVGTFCVVCAQAVRVLCLAVGDLLLCVGQFGSAVGDLASAVRKLRCGVGQLFVGLGLGVVVLGARVGQFLVGIGLDFGKARLAPRAADALDAVDGGAREIGVVVLDGVHRAPVSVRKMFVYALAEKLFSGT